MSHTHLSRLERGLHETKTGTLAILCEALGCTIDELVTIEHGGACTQGEKASRGR